MTTGSNVKLPVVISYSGGASSEWLVQGVIEGVLARPDHLAVVFADTGAEHAWTYEAVDEVRSRCRAAGIEFLEARADGVDLETAQLALPMLPERSRLDHPPYWLRRGNGRGRANHRCTRHYKVAPMRGAVSEWLAREDLPKQVVKWIGYGRDELSRALKAVAKNDVQWERLDFPAIRAGKVRGEVRQDVKRWTGRAPRFSMCVGCPFKSPQRWQETPAEEQRRGVALDEAIRDASAIGLENDAYLSDRLIPISRLLTQGDPQPVLPSLESYCDGGACFL